jgi:hypothetical protein
MAIIKASRALARAALAASPCAEERNDTLDRVSSPTAMTVSSIINDSVTTSAKPFRACRARVVLKGDMGFSEGFCKWQARAFSNLPGEWIVVKNRLRDTDATG